VTAHRCRSTTWMAASVVLCGMTVGAFTASSAGLLRPIQRRPTRAIQATISIYEVVPNAGHLGSVVLTGGITDTGSDHIGVLDRGTMDKIVLSRGTFEVSDPFLQKGYIHGSARMNVRTCSLVLQTTTSESFSHGTGAYRGISGMLHPSLTRVSVLPHRSRGSCGGVNSSQTKSVEWLEGTGMVLLHGTS
jgi:hypothetical protein